MKYVIATSLVDPTQIRGDDTPHLHYADGDGGAMCKDQGSYQEASPNEEDIYDVCDWCKRNHTPIAESATEAMLIHTKQQWVTARQVSNQTRFSKSRLQQVARELFDDGDLYKRQSVTSTSGGGKPNAYSQEPPTNEAHQANNKLFESMLNGD